MKRNIYIIILFSLLACTTSNENIIQNYPQDPYLVRKQRAGNLFGNKDGIILLESKENQNNNIDDNIDKNNLWQKSIMNISKILPISIIDESSGLITTDWGIIQNITDNNNLYKINIIIKNKKILEDNIEISVFKKEYNGNIILDSQTTDIIKNIILYQ